VVVTAGKEPASLVAAEAWATLDSAAARDALQPWLGSGDAKVKLLAARALLQAGEASAISSLLELMDSPDLPTKIRAHQTLRAATAKNDLPFTAYADAGERTRQLQAWKDWYEANKDSVKLVLPLPESGAQLGRTLVCSHGRNRIVEYDATGKELKSHSINQPWSVVGLPNGNRLVAVTSQQRVAEYDENWKEVWAVDGLPTPAWGVDRSADGITVIACADRAQVIEVAAGEAKEKKVLWQGDGSGRPVFVRRLENGNTLICLQGPNKVIEIDRAGKQVWEASNVVNPFSAQRLESGNTLIASMLNGRNGQIVEVDSSGKQVKVHKSGLPQLYAAQRSDDGHIVYVDQLGLHEIDADGKPVAGSEKRENNLTGLSRF
jgi:hypothetical protein